MASILLDSIINDTVESFRGRGADPLLALTSGQQQVSSASSSSSNSQLAGALNSSASARATMSESLEETSVLAIEMGPPERLFWILLFSLMVLVAAGGNLIVIHVVSTNKEMKSVTNYFLVNLSLADTMVSTLNVIFNFISMLNSHWPFGSIYCKISNFIAILSISASVFTLTAISCDRYNAILHPLRPRMSHRHALGWILLIWTLSATLALPNMIYSVVVEDRLVNEQLALTCTMIWPDGRYPLSSYDHIYNIIILVLTYLVPILTMAILYYNVGRELWGYEAIGENVEKQARAMLAKKKIVKMMIVVVIIFALCWLPYHGFFVVNYYLPTIFQDGPLLYQRCYLFMYWLAMSNSMYNPIIIYFMNSKFRHEFRRVLCFVCCCRAYSPPVKTAPGDNQSSTNQAQQPAGSNSRANSLMACGRQFSSSASTRRQMPKANNSSSNNNNNNNNSENSNALTGGQSKQLLAPIEIVVTESAGERQTGDLIGGPTCDWPREQQEEAPHLQRTNESPAGRKGFHGNAGEREPFLKCANGTEQSNNTKPSNSGAHHFGLQDARHAHLIDATSPGAGQRGANSTASQVDAIKVWI